MPNTYVALRTQVVPTATTSVTLDLTGVTGYTDLELVASVQATTSGQGLAMQFNNDNGAGSLYSNTGLRGNGTTTVSFRQSNNTNVLLSNIAEPPTTGFGSYVARFMNYANTSIDKIILVRSNSAGFATEAFVDLWRNSNAITSIKISISGGNIAAGSTFTVYGIANADQGAAKATGGIITEDANYWYHTFGASGAFTPKQSLTADVLVIAGGGSGSSGQSGTYYGFGGGAGEVKFFGSQALTANKYDCLIGGGGTSIGNGTIDINGNPGTTSQFGALTAATAGGGAKFNSPGGASGNGFLGGAGNPTATGGGAGAGANGSAAPNSTTPGAGGNGLSTYSSWGAVTGIGQNISNTFWLGGGGGGVYTSTVAAGGYGGGGGGLTGGASTTQAQRNGMANTGSGGSGGGNTAGNSGAGGSGVIIVRYAKV